MFTDNNSQMRDHLIRPRLTALLEEAARNPLTIVCAWSGCGKTRAVCDFLRQRGAPAVWMRFNERDNDISHFWNSFTQAASDKIKKLAFPGTADKMNHFISVLNNSARVVVIDDFHLARERAVIEFTEKLANEPAREGTMILICRGLPQINFVGLQSRGLISEICEDDLNFTQDETERYFNMQGLSVGNENLREIFRDTKGWALSVNLIARSLQKSPGYSGYAKNTLKQNIRKLMETTVWDVIPMRLQYFLARLSLLNHFSADLAEILAGNDQALMTELKRANAYMRFDGYSGAYLIHPLFLDFLLSKQNILTDEEKYATYKAAADWCIQNGFKIDALNYFEKIGDYESVMAVLLGMFSHMPHDAALCAAGIFERAPSQAFDRIDFFAVAHLYSLLCLNRYPEFFALAEEYRQKFIALPGNDTLRNHTLGGIYFLLGSARMLVSMTDGRYDFEEYFVKSAECLMKSPSELIQKAAVSFGPWVSSASSTPREYAEVVSRTAKQVSHCFGGAAGFDDLCRGELKFYQGDIQAAEALFLRSLENTRKHRQFEAAHRALFYIIKTAVLQGSRAKAGQAMKDIEAGLDESGYPLRFITRDISVGWYYSLLRQADMFPEWLKGPFTPYPHACSIENFGNQIKARYHYLTKNYLPLLTYIDEMKRRESCLFGRIEMLAMEACVYYQMKNKEAAFDALRKAYQTAAPDAVITPFIELGKDMRTLIMAALRQPDCGGPVWWLESVRHKATAYAKNQSMFVSEYQKQSGAVAELSARERDILSDLYNGMSRSSIAGKRNLSVNTVKMIINGIYEKLNAHKISDAIRIAAERKLV